MSGDTYSPPDSHRRRGRRGKRGKPALEKAIRHVGARLEEGWDGQTGRSAATRRDGLLWGAWGVGADCLVVF